MGKMPNRVMAGQLDVRMAPRDGHSDALAEPFQCLFGNHRMSGHVSSLEIVLYNIAMTMI
jgi:hypothetical protein